jgi:hypothetical protein
MALSQSADAAIKPNKRFLSVSLFQGILLAVALLAGLGIRLYDLKDPPLDFHPTRQLRSAIIARSIYYQINPSADPQKRIESLRIANSMEVYEPPIFEGLVAFSYLVIGQEVLWVSRIWSAIFWIIGGFALFSLARRFASFYASLLGLMFYLFLPFSIIASRSFQPDPWMVMWLALALWGMYRWAETYQWKWALLAGATGGIAVLVKAVAALPVAAAFAGLVLGYIGIKKAIRSPQAWSAGALLVIPSLLYYVFSLGARSGSFLSFWTVALSHLVLTSHFYAEWLGMLHGLFGLSNLFLAILGVFLAKRAARSLLAGAWLGYILYGLMFPYQMTTHEYYHIQVVLLVGLSLVLPADMLLRALADQKWIWRAAAFGLVVFAAGYCLYSTRSVMYVSSSANEAIAWRRMGEALPKNGNIIALTSEYGNRLKYYGWRSLAGNWPTTGDMNLSELAGNNKMDFASYFEQATERMNYFLVTAFGELDAQPELKQMLTQHYPILMQGDGFVLYDLMHPLGN